MKMHAVSFTLLVCFLGLIATPLRGQDDHFWINPAGGEFVHPENWSNGVPGALDTAIFDLNAVYDVDVVSNATIDSLHQSDGELTLSGGNKLTLDSRSFIEGTMNLRGQGTELDGRQFELGSTNGMAQLNIRQNSMANFSSLTVGTGAEAGSLTVESGGTVNSSFVILRSGLNSSPSTLAVNGPGSTLNLFTFLNVGPQSPLSGVANASVNDGGQIIVGGDTGLSGFGGGLYVGSGSVFVRYGSQLDTRGVGVVNGSNVNHQVMLGRQAGETGRVTVSGNGSQLFGQVMTLGYEGTGNLTIEDGASVFSSSNRIGDRSGSVGNLMITGNGSSLTTEFGSLFGVFGTSNVNVEDGGLLSTGNTSLALSNGTSTVTVVGSGSRWENSGYLKLRSGSSSTSSLILAQSGVVSVGGSTFIGSNASVEVYTNTRFEFGTTDLDSYRRISGAGGDVAGTIDVSGYNQIDSLADYSIAAVDTSGVRSGNSGVIYGSGFSTHGVSNFSGAEIRTLGGEWARFDGRGNSNAGEINNFGGVIEFSGDLTNEADGFIGGRGQFIAGGGLTNNGVMAFSAGNADVLGDVVNASGGQIVTSGFGVTTFFDDVEHNGTEIRTADGSATVFLGEVSGAGSYTGTGDVFFEGDLRPGNSPDVVAFEGDVFFGTGASTSIELAGLALGEFDMLDIEGDLSLNGSLDVSLLSGFALDLGQEFLIANVEGSVNGQFDLYGEGDLVGNYGGRDLFISYSRGSGNDIGLFTTSVPEPGTAGVLGIALIGLMIRRRRQKTPVKSVKIRSCLLAMLVIATVSSTAGTVAADIIVTNRQSHGAFDVFGVYPGEFERRNVSDESTSLTGMFTMSESFDAVVTNGFATGNFDHTDNVVSTNTELNITSTASMQGSATQGIDAVASSSIAEFLHVNFTVTGEGANYRMTGDFDPADAFGDSIYLTESLGGLDAFRYSTEQAFDVTGALAAGDYTFRVNNGSATNDNTGFAFSGGHNFTLSVNSVPEPGSLAFLGFLGAMIGLNRRSRTM